MRLHEQPRSVVPLLWAVTARANLRETRLHIMTDLKVREREKALLRGRWGDSAEIFRNLNAWYHAGGCPISLKEGRELHPLGHYAVLLQREEDEDDLLMPEAIAAGFADHREDVGPDQ